MKSIVKELKDLRALIIADCAADEQLLTVEERQWIDRLDSVTIKAKTLFNNVDLADVSKLILGMAIDSANKTSKIYVSKKDQELCEHEFFKGAMWFAQKLNELEYDKFSGSWKIKGEQRKVAVAISVENA